MKTNLLFFLSLNGIWQVYLQASCAIYIKCRLKNLCFTFILIIFNWVILSLRQSKNKSINFLHVFLQFLVYLTGLWAKKDFCSLSVSFVSNRSQELKAWFFTSPLNKFHLKQFATSRCLVIIKRLNQETSLRCGKALSKPHN